MEAVVRLTIRRGFFPVDATANMLWHLDIHLGINWLVTNGRHCRLDLMFKLIISKCVEELKNGINASSKEGERRITRNEYKGVGLSTFCSY